MTPSLSAPGTNPADNLPPVRRDPLASLRIERFESLAPRTTNRKRRRRAIIVALLLLIVGAFGTYKYGVRRGWYPAGVAGISGIAKANWVPDIIQNRPEVRLTTVQVQTGQSADAVVVATGYVESRRQARIGARAPGRVKTISFEEGSKVKFEDVLAVLEHADMDAALAAAEASVARAASAVAEQEVVIKQALRESTRAEALWKQQSISESERDHAKFTYDAAIARKLSLNAELELAMARRGEAEQLKENMFIRAPFDGTVISKDAEVGESILPGGMGEASGRGSVATIADLEHLEVECDVKEDFITRIEEGGKAEIAIDAVPGRKYHGTVRKVIPMGDRARATIKVQVAITDADKFLFPEMSGTVYFLPSAKGAVVASEAPRFFCPSTSVVTDESGESFVWMVDSDSHAKKVPVVVGESRDEKVEILKGLAQRDRVIVRPESLTEGQPVKLVE